MIRERRSVRNYKQEKVSRSTMAEIVELARWAPSWANTQIARYTIVDDEAIIKRIADEGVHGFAYNMGTLQRTKGVAVLSFVKGKSGKLAAGKAGDEGQDFGSEWEMFDAGIACQTFCLAAHAKGVGTCVFGVMDGVKVKEIVGLPQEETVAAIITFGYPEGETRPTPRQEVEKILRFI